MCRIYSSTRPVEAMRQMFKPLGLHPSAGNLPSQPAIFTAQHAPVVRLDADGANELVMMHWGFILPRKDRAPTIIVNTRDDSARIKPTWVKSFNERRCLVPATSFGEYHPKNTDEKGHRTVCWFDVKGEEPMPLFAFAGIWRQFSGKYKGEDREMLTHSIMTTKPNAVTGPIHDRMPVILDPADHEQWLHGSPDEAEELLRPYPAEKMHMAFEGDKTGNRDAPAGPVIGDLFS